MRICIIASNKLMLDNCCAFLINGSLLEIAESIQVITPFKITLRLSRFLEQLRVIFLSKNRKISFNFNNIVMKVHYNLVISAEPIFPNHISGDNVIVVGHSPIFLKYKGNEIYPYLSKRLLDAQNQFERVIYLESFHETYKKIVKENKNFKNCIKVTGSPYFDKESVTKEIYSRADVILGSDKKSTKVLIQSTWGPSLIEEQFQILCQKIPKMYPEFEFYFSLHHNHFFGPYSAKNPFGKLVMECSKRTDNVHLITDQYNRLALMRAVDFVITDHNALVVLAEFYNKKTLVYHPSNSRHDIEILETVCANAVHVKKKSLFEEQINLLLCEKSKGTIVNSQSLESQKCFVTDYKKNVSKLLLEIL